MVSKENIMKKKDCLVKYLDKDTFYLIAKKVC